MTLPTGRTWGLYYNFAPFEENGHLLWMPVRFSGPTIVLPHFPQKMDKDLLEDVVILFAASEGFLYFFNSLHAGATQHHFHYQLIWIGGQPFLIETIAWEHENGWNFINILGLQALVFSAHTPGIVDRLWQAINAFQKKGWPFNMSMIRGNIYLIPRNPDHEITEEFPYGVLASVELSGRLIIADEKNYNTATFESAQSAFAKSGWSRADILAVIGK